MRKSKRMNNLLVGDFLRRLEVGDKVRVNGWEDFFTVRGKSENYLVADNGEDYSVISMKPNSNGECECGPDWWIFGHPLSIEPGFYKFNNPELVDKYLQSFETGESQLSRSKVVIESVEIKRKGSEE